MTIVQLLCCLQVISEQRRKQDKAAIAAKKSSMPGPETGHQQVLTLRGRPPQTGSPHPTHP